MSDKNESLKRNACICRQLQERIEELQKRVREKIMEKKIESQTSEIIIHLQEKRIIDLELTISKVLITIGSENSKYPQLKELKNEMLEQLSNSILTIN